MGRLAAGRARGGGGGGRGGASVLISSGDWDGQLGVPTWKVPPWGGASPGSGMIAFVARLACPSEPCCTGPHVSQVQEQGLPPQQDQAAQAILHQARGAS